jgi:putative flippase GtrA
VWRNKFKRLLANKTFFRWLLVGTTSLILDIGAFTLGYQTTTSVFAANFFAAAISTTFNYSAHYFWTFTAKSKHRSTITRYAGNIFLLWLASSLLIKFLIDAGLSPISSKFYSLALILPINFFTLRQFVYRRKSKLH